MGTWACSMCWCTCGRASKVCCLGRISESLSVCSSVLVSLSLPLSFCLSLSLSRKLNECYFTHTNVLQNSLLKSKLASHFQACSGGLNNDRTWARSGCMSHNSHSWLPESLSLSNLSGEPAVRGRPRTGNQISPICVHICSETSVPDSGEFHSSSNVTTFRR